MDGRSDRINTIRPARRVVPARCARRRPHRLTRSKEYQR
ncbi:hypothetical protein BURMUCF2_A0527 [Burkholderia multivorans CF2]|nr:hypothetical protein BURMUCGD1_4105 [Burkholderia multivorans CGD1]EJO59246.1 hypothetical protein BURMUCF2_A0527 [Burkholderia multivorans CF2]